MQEARPAQCSLELALRGSADDPNSKFQPPMVFERIQRETELPAPAPRRYPQTEGVTTQHNRGNAGRKTALRKMVSISTPQQRKLQQQERIKLSAVVGISVLLSVLTLFHFLLSKTNHEDSQLRFPANLKRMMKHKNEPWPELSEVYDGRKVTGDPQFLLDFAVIGFEKSGTSTLMKWFGAHPQIQFFQEEIYDLYRNRTGSMVWRLHTQLEPGWKYKRGYKSPIDIYLANALHLLDQYFPKTKLFLALRHPVRYYESLYNFRIQNLPGANDPFIKPLEGLGDCKVDAQGVCTDHANFAQYMYRLGKTVSLFPTDTEKAIIEANPKSASKVMNTRNHVFVVEMSQFTDDNELRKYKLRSDLKEFLGLEGDLPATPFAKPGKQWPEDVQAIKESRKMNICDEENLPLREELMRLSRQSSIWIRESFLQSDDVFYSSPAFFESAMMKWMDDPCENGYEGYQLPAKQTS